MGFEKPRLDLFKPKGEAGEKAEIDWVFIRKVDDYTMFEIKASFLITNMLPVIIKKGDKEIKTNEGNIFLRMKGTIRTDWQNRWGKNKFLAKLQEFYERYLYFGTLFKYWIELEGEITDIENDIKSFLNLSTPS